MYSERELEHAFSRLGAFTPDLFAQDMLDEVSLAINARVVLVRYDDIKAASEFTQQYCAVSELLTNAAPTLVTAAKSRCIAYEDELGLPLFRFTKLPTVLTRRLLLFSSSISCRCSRFFSC